MSTSIVKKVPEACIKKPGVEDVYCTRFFRRENYAFEDPAYAVKHYASSTAIRACPDCIAKVPPGVV